MVPGIEIQLEDGIWRVISVEDGDGDPIDHVALCLRQ